jgi:site-specific recombinase
MPTPRRTPEPRLATLLAAVAAEPCDVAVEQAWFEALVRWLLDRPPSLRSRHSPRTAALEQLVAALADPTTGPAIADRIRRVWGHTSTVRFLAETGLSDRTSFLAEVGRRLANHLLPRLEPKHDLMALIERLDLKEVDADWIETLPEELTAPWGRLLRPRFESIHAAAELVAVRAAAVGLARDILALQPVEAELDSPFFHLPRTVRAVVESAAGGSEELAQGYATWQRFRRECLDILAAVDERLEEHGVSSDLVFRRELLDVQLLRIDRLLAIEAGTVDGQAFASRLVRQSVEHRSLRLLIRATLKRLARKVVERTGETGEHYLVRSRAEWQATLRAGAGAGILTAFTALGKYAIGALPIAPAELGIAMTGDYAVSFLLLQAWHLTLSSKQPAAMAAALAGALEAERGVATEVDMIAAICRCQSAATIANIALVVPVAVGIAWGWQAITGHGILAIATATHTVAGLDPVRSWTILFAALTGVALWASTIAGGWTANWSAYRRLPEAIAASPRIRRVLGGSRTRRLADLLDRQLGGIAGNVAIGFLLGFMPVAFVFVGLPIEVRHVTLSAGSLALSATVLAGAGRMDALGLAWAAAGILVVGALNFSVAFGLALRVATRARGLNRVQRRAVWRAVGAAFRAQPSRFLWRTPA